MNLSPMRAFALDLAKRNGIVSPGELSSAWGEYKGIRRKVASRDNFGNKSAAYRTLRDLAFFGFLQLTATTPYYQYRPALKPATSYTCTHIPTGETWVLLGIDYLRNRACVAGYPACMVDLDKCGYFEERGPLEEGDLAYREAKFGKIGWN